MLTYQGARYCGRIMRARYGGRVARAALRAHYAGAVLFGRTHTHAQRKLLQVDRTKGKNSIFANVVRVVLDYQWPTANA